MAHRTADLVRDYSTSTGTGVFTLSATPPRGHRTFSEVCSVSDTFFYSIRNPSYGEWEVGLGTYSATNQITRTTVIASSNANSAVNFSAGTKDVYIVLAASKTVQQNASGNVVIPGQVAGKYLDNGTNTAAQALASNSVVKNTISSDITLTTTVADAGARATVIIFTSGGVSRTVTFGSGFKSQGTLTTGATASRYWCINFVSDGTNMIETGRTTTAIA